MVKRLRAQGRVIRERREALGWNLDEAASRIGISRQALSYIEQGFVRHPRPLTLAAIADVLKVKLEDIAL